MSFYQTISRIGSKYLGVAKTFKWGFNLSPMYRRSTGRIEYVSDDLYDIRIRLPISYKNRNYMGTIFGGSMFSAVDPIPMVQLINLLGNKYVVWDKAAEIYFKRPGNEDLYAYFQYTKEELEEIIARVESDKEIEIIKVTKLTNKDQSILFCEIRKPIYIADKEYLKKNEKKVNPRIIVSSFFQISG
ncbi:MAG: DUF4442 domain-containing protein [Sphingobacterium sp.]